MNINSMVSGLVKKADLAGGLLGFLTGSTHGLGDVQSSLENLLQGQVHIPDVKAMLDAYINQPYFRNALYLWLFGWGTKEFKVPMIGKYGGAMQKFAQAYGLGSFLNMLLWSSTHSDEGSNPSGSSRGSSGSSPSWGYKA